MLTLTTIAALREQLTAWRRSGDRIALVPTMGNLHQGHLELVRQARLRAERVVVTLFVNPLQFGAGEDLAAYPRTPTEDGAALEAEGADLLFSPSESEVYPHGREAGTRVEVTGLSSILDGASRPGHFVGVTTVVTKLFNMVQPDIALFGLKDFQQFAILKQMVRDLDLPIEMVGVPTVRESDGLAMSSRNGYLSSEERALAPALFRQLQATAAAMRGGRRDYAVLAREGEAALSLVGFLPDYLEVRSANSLALPGEGETALVILVAARLGKTRLIDNLMITL